MNNYQQLRNKVEQLKGQKTQLKNQLREAILSIKNLKEQETFLEQAREIVKEVGLQTQRELQFHISDITTLALESVFDEEAYQLKVEFLQRRNKTECDLTFVKGNNELEPMESSGYGAVDVASFALRVVSWSIQFPRTRNVIVLDEPLRFLSNDRQEFASKMIKELSDRLGIQFIIVTHEDILTQYADKVFQVSKKKNKSSKVN